MHPDQMYQLRQLRHQDLRAAVEQASTRRAFANRRRAGARAWLTTQLRWLGMRPTHAATPTVQPGSSAATKTA